jgi:Cu(I)/Ag(I) efflux system membrane fusion protein
MVQSESGVWFVKRRPAIAAALLVLVCLGFAAGLWTGRHRPDTRTASPRLLYYVDPMHPAYRSDKPGIAPDCGMALVPVYEGDSDVSRLSVPAGGVVLSPERQQIIGIRITAPGNSQETRTVRTTGRVVPDENHLYRIQAGFDGWVESLKDNPPGTLVRKTQVLATLYSPDIRAAEANYVGFMAGVERLKQGMAQSDMKSIDDSRHINEEQLRLLGMGEDEITQLGTTHHATSSLNLVAPGDGIVLSRTISPQQRFEKGAELYRIADLSKVWIVADLEGSDGNIRPGTRVKVNVPELGKTVYAKVSASTPLFDEVSRTLKLRLEADNPGFALRPNMFADVEFELSGATGLSIPAEAVLDSGLRKIVYVETRDGLFEPRTVEIAGAYGDRVSVASGITAADRVVIAGNFLLDSESRMRSARQPAADAKPASSASIQPIAATLGHANVQREAFDAGVRDPVCGMTLKPGEIAFQVTFRSKKFSLCSDSCRKKFQANPGSYAEGHGSVAALAQDGAAHGHD